jgi:8-oxo-dGTP pyrophosphatase MutT (NUDIX family)
MTIDKNDPRFTLLQLLERYKPEDENDRSQRDRIQQFVRENKNCFERTNLAGHITGSAWVVDKLEKRVLLTHHKKLGKWLQLGGHSDGDPDTLSVALREAQEESGLTGLKPVSKEIFDIDSHDIPARCDGPAHIHYDIRFLFQVSGTDKFKISDESNELAWIDIDKVGSVSKEESLLRMARKFKNGGGFEISGVPR